MSNYINSQFYTPYWGILVCFDLSHVSIGSDKKLKPTISHNPLQPLQTLGDELLFKIILTSEQY